MPALPGWTREAGCGKVEGSGPGAAPRFLPDTSSMPQPTLRVALVDGPRFTPLYDRLGEFTAETGHPVDVERLPLSGVLERLRGGDSGLHLISGHSRYTGAMAGDLLPLDDQLAEEEAVAFSELALDLCRWEGRLRQLPRSVETKLLFYRSDIFDDRREQEWFAEASDGRTLRIPQSWDELAAVAQYFTRAGKMFGFAYPGDGPGVVESFAEIVTTVGGTFFDPEGRPRFLSRAGDWALTLLRDLHQRWGAVPPGTPDAGPDDVSEAFRMGQCAMVCDYIDTARLLCDPSFSAVPGWHSVALCPSGADGRRAVTAGCPTFALPAGCPDPGPALELLRFLTSHESQLTEARHGAYPSRTAALEEYRDSLFDGTLARLRLTLAEQTLRMGPLTAPRLAQYPEVEAGIAHCLNQAIRGACDVVEALETAQRATEETLGGPA
jgi:multiple sugar transport system substrate-binding protein